MASGTPESEPAGTVVVLTSDLAVASMVHGAAQQAGATSVMALDADALSRRLEESSPPALVVVHLESRGLDIAALMERVRSLPQPPRGVIAFGPHVHEARLEAARQAGCDEVLSKGGFHARAAQLFAEYLR